MTPSSPPEKWSLFTTPRIDAPELLDQGFGTAEDVQINLREMARINRYLGGYFALTRQLYPRLRRLAPGASVADIGTGSGDLLAVLRRWSQQQQRELQLIGVDFAARHIAIARRDYCNSPEIRFIQADANHLPLAPQSVDFVVSSLFLHHLEPGQIVTLLRQSFRAARHGVVMSDLVRGWMPLISFKLVQPVFARHAVTRLDGETSIRRSYTPTELLQLAREAGLQQARMYSTFPWRMTLVIDR